MEKIKIDIPAAAAAILLILLCMFGHASSNKIYLFRMKTTSTLSSFEERAQLYTSSLESMAVDPEIKQLYLYKHINLCSVSLTDEEAQLMASNDNVETMYEDNIYHPQTTRTPFFLGMEDQDTVGLLPEISKGSQIVIGVLDTGVWPESKSFDDEGLGAVPEKWKGGCEGVIKCNRKLVGARAFSKGYQQYLLQNPNSTKEKISPRDADGHGTHTSSTAGGSPVPNASLGGFANGTAQGMLPSARIAMYKVCWNAGCFGSDIMAAMDQAIEDNVDVLSLSIGGGAPDFYRDTIAVGAFAAMRNGILVSCSAGNSGPAPSSLTNVAPWILTVGAGTLDRDFLAPLKLGSNKTFHGVSLFKGKRGSRALLPMVYARDTSTDRNTSLCLAGTLVPAEVKGKIVLCDRGVNARVEKGGVVRDAGGLGMVLANDAKTGDELVADAHVLPATHVSFTTGNEIKKYLASARKKAIAGFRFRGTVVGIKPSPVLAAFSSRGPNPVTPDILKPDLIAPGVNILAAWPKAVAPTELASDKRRVNFNIISGTSMSCPHVSGLAAMLKAAHRDWSPAAIRSALMTTAYSTYTNGKAIQDSATGMPATLYGMGAGHVKPMAALDPGLVYDLSSEDYCNFLCALKYIPKHIKALTNTNFTCEVKKKYRASDLNYPSFVVSFGEASEEGGVNHTRTLTNVGKPKTYKVSVLSPSSSVKITVLPKTLTFSELDQKKSYTINFQVVTPMQADDASLSARIEWSDGKHVVGSPIAFMA